MKYNLVVCSAQISHNFPGLWKHLDDVVNLVVGERSQLFFGKVLEELLSRRPSGVGHLVGVV